MTCPIVHCIECGEELWGHSERGGLCVSCQENERYEHERGIHDAWDDEEAAACECEDPGRGGSDG
jgi:hypothetical protein